MPSEWLSTVTRRPNIQGAWIIITPHKPGVKCQGLCDDVSLLQKQSTRRMFTSAVKPLSAAHSRASLRGAIYSQKLTTTPITAGNCASWIFTSSSILRGVTTPSTQSLTVLSSPSQFFHQEMAPSAISTPA